MGTLVAFAAIVGTTTLLWLKRSSLVGLWLPPLFDPTRPGTSRYVLEEASVPEITIQVLLTTGALLTLPLLHAHLWRFICRLTRRDDAYRFAVPYCLAAACAWLLAFWLARHLDYPPYLVCI